MTFLKNGILSKVLLFALSALTAFSLWGCLPEAATSETEADPSHTEALAETQKAEEEKKPLFEIKDEGGSYSYIIYNSDYTVAEEMTDCETAPDIVETSDGLLRITLGDETYYFDPENRIFSDTFTNVYDESGSLLVRAEQTKLIICDIFDENGYYTELVEFSYGLSYMSEFPITGACFIDGGSAVKVDYISGYDMSNVSECFNISNGSRFVIVEDWRNQKQLVSADEAEYVENYLYSYMGRIEPNTGFSYIYDITGSIDINGERFFFCECSWIMIEEDQSETVAPVSTFVVSETMTEVYDCRDDSGDLKIYTEDDML